MSILVTGATGFLGTHLVAELARRGAGSRVRALSKSPSTRSVPPGVEAVTGDVLVPGDVARALAGVREVYHLAGQVSRRPEDAHDMYRVHVEGTRVLCEAAAAAGVRRIVLASSSGTTAVAERADESVDEECAPPVDIIGRWPYYASKLYQEQTARRMCEGRIELVIVQPSLLLGPGDDRLSSTRDVLSLLSGEVPVAPPGGLNFVDVRDVAAVLPAAMERGRPGERYLLGGYNWSFADFFGRLERLAKVPGPWIRARAGARWPFHVARAQAAVYRALGRTPPVEPSSVEMARYFWYFDSTRARTELGFEVREAATTLLDTITYLREHVLGR